MKNNIKQSLFINSIVSYVMLAIAIFALLCNVYVFRYSLHKAMSSVYVQSVTGELIPLTQLDRRENLEIEAKHHLTILVENFYEMTQTNWKGGVERSLWLGNIKSIYDHRASLGYYSRILQYSIVYTATIKEVLVQEDKDSNFQFLVILDQTLTGEGLITEVVQYELRGVISITDRHFPYNPHGMYIESIIENKIENNED